MSGNTTDLQQLEDWSRSRPNLVLINSAVNPSPEPADLPPELVERLNGARPDFLVASRDELDRIGIVLAHDQLARFQKGEPILMIVGRVDHRVALKRGRRQKEELERHVQDALAIQTYIGVERLCAWLQARDGRRLAVSVPELRERVIELLATEAWLDDPNTGANVDDERRRAFVRTQFDAGSRLVCRWYPWTERPDDLSRVAREIVDASALHMDRAVLEESIWHEFNLIRFMLRCLHQATRLVLTAHAMSADIRKHDRMSRNQQAMLSGATMDRPTLYEAVRAALDGDFNPSELFGSLLSYHDALELARLLGRHGRGHDVRLDASVAREMKRMIAIRDRFDAEMKQHPQEPPPFDEQAAALVITQAGFELFSRERWLSALDGAIAAGSAVTLSKTVSPKSPHRLPG